MTLRALLLLAATAVAVALPLAPLLAGTTPEEPTTPTVLEANDDEVKLLLDAVERSEADKKSNKLLIAALIDMETRRHEAFEPIIEDCIDHRDVEVQERAIRAAASNGMEGLSKKVLKILKSSKKKKKGKKKGQGDVSGFVAAAAIDYVGRLAIEGVEDEVFEHLERLFLVETRMQASYAPDLVRGALLYLGQMKYEKAVPKLVDMVREPIPENPNSPTNPPASYWESRHKIWQASEGWVRWALKEITEQEYRSHREWRAWLAANEKRFK